MSIFTLTFAKAAGERAVKTVAQTAAALLLSDATGLLDADWTAIGSVAGLAGLVSVLTSVGSGAVTPDSSPSLATETLDAAEDTQARVDAEVEAYRSSSKRDATYHDGS